ncbi:MAG TPA: D-alanine--D-alanine ligase [Patescibacteria group bacterium]|nr:D-alanine--D-alanine ligase [Patescibacteria group bacterium]
MKKLKVGIIFGGKSSEHEISIMSARNVYSSLDREKYEPILIGIGKNGKWYLQGDTYKFKASNSLKLFDNKTEVRLVSENNSTSVVSSVDSFSSRLDVVFPILHGTNGEDGTIQGLLKLANVPFVGAGVLGSAIGMDKDVAKRLLRDAKIPVAKFITLRQAQGKALRLGEELAFEEAKKKLGLPIFIKPANNGSSVGVSKVKSKDEFNKGLNEAFKYDNKILIEEGIDGREIECSVLGNDNPVASVPGEVITKHEFYSYEAKYFDESGSKTEIPAKLSPKIASKIQKMAVSAFKILNCEGMARVDFFLDKKGNIYVNEINTIPGFTNISMYPKLWEASGLSYEGLIDKLIDLAIERFNSEKKLQTSFV